MNTCPRNSLRLLVFLGLPFLALAQDVETQPASVTPPVPEEERQVITLPPIPEPTMQEDRISIALESVDLSDVVRMFTRISNANIIANPTSLVGAVTVNLNNVHWQPALESILHTHNLQLVEKPPSSGIFSIEHKKPDAPDPLIVETVFLKYATVTEVQSALTPVLIPEARVSLFPSRNALVIKSTAVNMTEIQTIINEIDRMREQVFIEAKFMELDDSAIQTLGVNWQALEGLGVGVGGLAWTYEKGRTRERSADRTDTLQDRFTAERSFVDYERRRHEARENRRFDSMGNLIDEPDREFLIDPITGGIITREIPVPVTLTDDQYQRGREREYQTLDSHLRSMDYEARDLYRRTVEDVRSAVLGIDDFRIVLSALRQTAGVTIVSNPKIIVANEEKATIHIGQTERPFVAVVTPATDNSAPFTTYNPGDPVDFGVKLDVTPTVNTASNISLLIEPTLTRFVANAVAPTGQTYPIIARKTISTRFTLEDGKTIAIGGLTETQDRDRVTKVPLLGDLPLIGRYLFTHTRKERSQTETVIFVTVGMASPDRVRRNDGLPRDTRLAQPRMLRQELERQQFEMGLEQMRNATEAAIETAPENPELSEEIRRIFGSPK